jgi:hypothetical protein
VIVHLAPVPDNFTIGFPIHKYVFYKPAKVLPR